jgi:hypothetical protein
VKILHPSDYRPIPWRNSGGVAQLIHMVDSSVGDALFDWRASLARIESDTPFSNYPGIDRSMVLIGDAAMVTHKRISIGMTRHSQPLIFAGEDALDMSVPHAPVTVFNFMSRRGLPHKLSRLQCGPDSQLLRDQTTKFIFSLDDDFMIVDGVRMPLHASVMIHPAATGRIDPDIRFAHHGEVLLAEVG